VRCADFFHAYVAAYFVTASILSGLRFTKEGGSAALLLMLMSLNTMGFSAVAEEQGLGFVASLWSESGTNNSSAVFRNSLIGKCWCSVCISFARLIPPARTVRTALSRNCLPKILRDDAHLIRLTVEYHVKDDVNEDDDDDDDQDEANAATGNADSSTSKNKNPEKIEDAILKIIQYTGLLQLSVVWPI
jgi:hypothetical protein